MSSANSLNINLAGTQLKCLGCDLQDRAGEHVGFQKNFGNGRTLRRVVQQHRFVLPLLAANEPNVRVLPTSFGFGH